MRGWRTPQLRRSSTQELLNGLRQEEQIQRQSAAMQGAILAELERRYLRLLDGLKVWDKQTARLFAIEHRECSTERRIVLVGLALYFRFKDAPGSGSEG